MSRSSTIAGIVLKRSNTGETDRVVTLLTQELGKVTTIAKGARKLHSSKASALEPGNYVKTFYIPTKSLPLLTQATLLADTGRARESLKKMRQLSQFLEIMDALFVEEELDPELYQVILRTRKLIVAEHTAVKDIRQAFEYILSYLGYHSPGMPLDSVLEKVSELIERPIRSYDFLVVKQIKA